MPRIRYLKPGFFEDEDIAALPHWVRLLYQGLWILSDRDGRLTDRPKWIWAKLFPYEETIDVESGLKILAGLKATRKRSFITRYEVDGEGYIQINRWDQHQRPHHTERKSEIPKCKSSNKLYKKTVNEPLENGLTPDKKGRDGDGDGDGDGELKDPQASPGSFKKVDLRDIKIKGLDEKSKHRIYNGIVDMFDRRGWKRDPEYLKGIFQDCAKGFEKYTPKDPFPYFRKAFANYIAKNAELLNAQARIDYKKPAAAQTMGKIMEGMKKP